MRGRFSIANLMTAVVFIAVGTAALRSASPLWASALFTATLGVLTTAVLGALFSGRRSRPFWVGFTLFGWGYMTLAFGPWFSEHVGPRLSTTNVLETVFRRANPIMATNMMGALPPIHTYYRHDPARQGRIIPVEPEHFLRIGHSLFALVAGLIGGLIARYLADVNRPDVSWAMARFSRKPSKAT